ncbi:MAG TPA: hypothetical protein VHW01_21715 [Polyangiaceae bacterium]|nr:hypothetical protein [Polyangiaceae bacterium]
MLAKVGAGATGGGDPEEALAAVCEALGLPEGTDPEVIGAAFTALLGAVNTAEPDDAASTDTTPPDPSAPGADPKTPPPGIPARLTQAGEIYLTPKQRQQIAAKGWTIPEFTALCKKIVRRA